MIICASRRTDIPAFHSGWFMNRIRAEYVYVRNPIEKTVVYRIDLSRQNVDNIVFMTKNPKPMIPHLKEIASKGYMYTFQVTITPYGRDLEPNVPFSADVADSFKEISERIGMDRISWRYDPVILNRYLGIDYHKRKFELICKELEGYTDRCIFSFLDLYGKFGTNTEKGILRSITNSEKDSLGKIFFETASKYGMSVSHCCSDRDLSQFGVSSRACVDRETMRRLDIPFEDRSKPLRKGCGCVKNIDIGAYDTCFHDCVYCYANGKSISERNGRIYDPNGEMLFGHISEEDRIVNLSSANCSRLEDF